MLRVTERGDVQDNEDLGRHGSLRDHNALVRLAHHGVDDGQVGTEKAGGAAAIITAVSQAKDTQHLSRLRRVRVVERDRVELLSAKPGAVKGDDDGQLGSAPEKERKWWHVLRARILNKKLLDNGAKTGKREAPILRGLHVKRGLHLLLREDHLVDGWRNGGDLPQR